MGRSVRLGGVDDAGIPVEGVERRRELGGVGRHALRLLGRDGILDDLGERGRSPGQGSLRTGGEGPSDRRGREPASAALRRIDAIRAWAYWT